MVVYAAIEGGGTSWKAALVNDDLVTIIKEETFETVTPEQTLAAIKEWLEKNKSEYCAVGVATFGPVDPRPNSPRYGYITSTPKPGWKDTDVIGQLGLRGGPIPFLFDTDVNAPAMAEYQQLQGQVTSCAYVTIGTGVGVGLVINGQTVKGLMHPEGGHIPVRRHPDETLETGICPYHPFCLEGYCNNLSVAKRLGLDRRSLEQVGDDDPSWELLAFYIAQLCTSLVLLVSVEKIVLGGGLMQRTVLFDHIRQETMKMLNGYIDLPTLTTEEGMKTFIVPPKHGSKAGILGAAHLAKQAWEQKA
eukprot:gene9700-10727_t